MAMTPLRQHIAILAEQDEQDRLTRYQRAWDAYENGCPLPFPDENGVKNPDNIRLDYARLIVDKGVSFLAGKGGVTLQVLPRDDPKDDESEEGAEGDEPKPADALDEKLQAAQAALDAAWSGLHLDHHNLAVNGGVSGHAWLRLYEPDRTGRSRITVLDSCNVTAVWNEDDVTIVVEYLIEWTTIDRETGDGVVRRKRIVPTRADPVQSPSSWTIFDEQLDDTSGGQWTVLDETPWAHEFPPVFGAQNLPSPNTFYGAADLEPAVLDMIEQLQSLAGDMRRICRLHGHPVPVIIGEDARSLVELDVSIGQLLAIPNDKAKLGQLVIAELTSLLAMYKEIKTALFEGAHIPKVAIGETANSGPTAGVALQVEYEPLIERTQTKQLTYGPLLTDTANALLDLLGYPGFHTALAWPDLLPHDQQADALGDEAELRMGIVSKQTIAENRGYDWDVEQDRIAEERKAGMEAQAAAFDRGNLGGELYGGKDKPPEPGADE
jgi:hypothetical protein